MDSLRVQISPSSSSAISIFAFAMLLLSTTGCSRDPIDAVAIRKSKAGPPPASIPSTNSTSDRTNADVPGISVTTREKVPVDEPLETLEPREEESVDPAEIDEEIGTPGEDALLAELAENGGNLDRALRAISVTVKESTRGEIVLVNLKGVHITDAALEKIKDLETLLVLDIWDAPITDAGLAHLADMTQLRALGLRNTRVTNNGLKHLSKLTSLKELNLTLTRVTDAGMQHLINLKSLHKLGLDDTIVTGNGVNELQDALPLCQIAW